MSEIASLLDDGTITDPFFQVIHDGEWNACIGKQGDDLNYVEGYLDAAQILVDTLIKQENYRGRDTLAMPILYNARHGLELALKFILRELSSINMAVPRGGAADHDVKAYWEQLSGQPIGDLHCRALIAELQPFALSLGCIDPGGQELRYFDSRDGKQSLAEKAVVNLPLIQASIRGLRDILGNLINRVFQLKEEVAAGAMTNECSRADLVDIARIVGPQARWIEESFLDRKTEAKATFGLSGNGLSRALTAIREGRQLRTLIGLEAPLAHLTAGLVLEVAARWLQTYPPPTLNSEPIIISADEIDFEEMVAHGEAVAALDNWVIDRLSVEEFADLETVFYIGRDQLFGEFYERKLDGTLIAHRLEPNRSAVVDDIMSKTNFLDGLIAGLSRVGQPNLSVAVEQLQNGARRKI
ncbi:hypothetical protein SKP52_14990 [Sphingopyxis fribergensis]|uniref:Uncharacterized protein n=1 Tax=Sphingopyxis fribergensis TaxID=1515612 RepID=A0A0A7PIQ5_9SPHN|nr:hypothetical protein [Sphingopyxis fribergensis]AJA09880.1 hypothetical protein SKP52_14990 [Sphingopyxis fribergensis]